MFAMRSKGHRLVPRNSKDAQSESDMEIRNQRMVADETYSSLEAHIVDLEPQSETRVKDDEREGSKLAAAEKYSDGELSKGRIQSAKKWEEYNQNGRG